jgi:hypothetical protein
MQWKYPSSPSTKIFKVTPSAYGFLGFSGSTANPFSESWWKCEFCVVLWSSAEASRCNSQKTSRPTGKRSTASSRQCQTPYSPRIKERQWELLEHAPYSPHLAPSDFHLFGPLKYVSLMAKRLKRRCGNGLDNSQKTSLLGFRRAGKAMGQVYQCWWRICLEKFFLTFKYHMFYVLYQFVTYFLTLPRSYWQLCKVTYIRYLRQPHM